MEKKKRYSNFHFMEVFFYFVFLFALISFTSGRNQFFFLPNRNVRFFEIWQGLVLASKQHLIEANILSKILCRYDLFLKRFILMFRKICYIMLVRPRNAAFN